MNNLGELCHEQGDDDAAQRYLVVSLETMERLLGKGTASTMPVLKNLACHYLDSGKLDESYSLLLRYLKFQTNSLTAEGGGEGLGEKLRGQKPTSLHNSNSSLRCSGRFRSSQP